MAVIKDKNIGIAAIPLSFKRDNPIPIDTTMVWYNYAAMEAYAKSSPVSYVGQLLSLVDAAEGTTKVYVIKDLAGNLELINGTEGDYLPITGGTLTGDLTLNDGSLAASQTYVAEQIEAAGHLSREIVNELPPIAEAKPNTIYMIKDASVLSGDAYREYLLMNGEFVQIGDTSVDMTNVVYKAEPLQAGKLTAANQDGWLFSTNIAPEDIPVKGEHDNFISDELLEKVENQAFISGIGAGLELDENGILSAAIKNIGSGLELTDDGTLQATGGSISGIAGVKIEEEALPVVDNYSILSRATNEKLGVIKGGENVSIQADGTLNVEKVNTKILEQDEDDWLILNGSDANGTWDDGDPYGNLDD